MRDDARSWARSRKIDDRTEWDLIQIVEDAIGGSWQPAEGEWEARRDAVLDLIGKATPAAFRPALQIDPQAKILIEALSGRWKGERDRRDKRTVWFYVANAFSILLSGMQPADSKADDVKVLSNFSGW
jgi:hypothetical protein